MTRMKSGAVLFVLAAFAACDDGVLNQDPPPVQELPDGGGQFLGYSAAETKMTTCGNCHVGKQGAWEQTAHAHAWTTLQESGAAQALCEGCHSVSARGNPTTDENVGWVATHDERYQDVQCESCHGPGLTHVMNPDAVGTKPLASIAIPADMSAGCAECHSGSHHPFADEWVASRHSRVIPEGEPGSYRATNAGCVGCHEAKSVLKGWGVESTFLEAPDGDQHLAITCAVCHDPHNAQHEGQLRFALDVADEEQNLCMKCHHKRGRPDLTSEAAQGRGPHSPEGPLLLGTAGWNPPDFPVTALVGSHGSDRNPRLCATCHVNDVEYTDPITGSFSMRATGHSFQAIPCADETGAPSGETDCELAQRSFRACETCHLSQTAARSAMTVAAMRITRLADEIAALIAQLPASELGESGTRYTTGEGARFNMELARKKGAYVHNPFLVEALLLASIQQLQHDYGLVPTAGLALDAQLGLQ